MVPMRHSRPILRVRCLNKGSMRIVRAAIATLSLLFSGCQQAAEPLPKPPPPRSQGEADPGYPIKARPDCTSTVRAALRDANPNAIAKAASQGEHFTCSDGSGPTPLDEAVLNNAPGFVDTLLRAGADPNARWSSRGDRFPLQEIVEAHSYGKSITHRVEIMHLLFQHGADPNAQWCPFETRRTDPGWCTSKQGVTPLIMAAALDQADMNVCPS